MELIEQLAQAALEQDHLKLRSLVQDLTRSKTDFSILPRPSTTDSRLLVISAALTELLAQRSNQNPPAWTKEIGALKEPFFLLKSTATMKHLRKRLLYAPPHFLEFA